MKNKRVFWGISVDKILTSKLNEFKCEFSQKESQTPVNKWVKAENYHLTLLFIGPIPENKIPSICWKAEKLFSKTSSFYRQPKYYTTFPRRKSRMIWLEFIRSEGFEKLVNELSKSIFKTHPSNQIIPHITLTRFKHGLLTDRSWPIDPELKLSCTKVNLYESELTPEGPIYTSIQAFDLKG
ncbi:MAG: RNA 2',3'-cyclic phosphodiesterase [Bacteroidetes bacterium]|nr:MAG: RNA 2',3'-cyclic phosphodiesterase [Bacteroidota bacterium]